MRIPVRQLPVHVVAFRLLVASSLTVRRLVPLVLILVATWQSPSLARKWTSRTGGFSVEAELVDVRDGSAVSKKVSGEGELTFDLRRGLFAASKMKVRVTVHEGAVRVEVPIQVSYELVSEEEARQKAEADKLAKEGAKMLKELNRSVTLANLPELIQDLESDDIRKASAARVGRIGQRMMYIVLVSRSPHGTSASGHSSCLTRISRSASSSNWLCSTSNSSRFRSRSASRTMVRASNVGNG